VDRFNEVFEKLREHGLLLESDPKLLSVSGLIVGRAIKGSWWGHPKGRAIWLTTERLADHPDAMVLKLVAGKVTYVHRRLWLAAYTVARSNEPWQSQRLSAGARAILTRLRTDGWVRTDQLPRSKSGWTSATKELEQRLLVFSEELHTESGAHAKRLESWEHWARRLDLNEVEMTVAHAKSLLEQATESIGASGAAMLPWRWR
jgi:hypothetical protein